MAQFRGPNGLVTATGKLAEAFDGDPGYTRVERPKPEPKPAVRVETPARVAADKKEARA